ncbi:MAG: TrmH family RNA methyltransferase [Bacilli bacterium]|nr:TrmH family RNA methyltransferase [Bacilli bacterium]
MKYEKYKSQLDYSYTLGITLTIELLKRYPENVLDIYFHSSFSGESKELIEDIARNNNITPIQNDKIFNIVSQKENVYCIGVFKKFFSSIKKDENHVVLVNPSNAGNLGTIIRTSVGFNLNNLVIIKPAVDIFDPKAIRASMGALFRINYKLYDNFEDYKNEYKHNLYPFMLKAKAKLKDTSFSKPYSLIFGNEATGLPDSFLEYNSVIIPHSHNIDSLNLPIAVSIALYSATSSDF